MRTFVGLLFVVLSANCQSNAIGAIAAVPNKVAAVVANNTAANVASNTRVAANNAVTVNMQNAVKVDNDFLLQLLALKNIAMSMNQNNALTQLVQLHALWNNNNDLNKLFSGIDISAANIGLYYNAATQNFVLVDLSTGAATDIITLMSRLQAAAAASQNANAAVVASGLLGDLPIVGPLLGGLPIVGSLVRGLGN